MRRCLLTNDVETTSILNGGLRPETGIKVWKEGMPRLLDLYDKYNVKSTFFFIADFAQTCPDVVTMIKGKGHEVACHGLTHEHYKAFDILTLEEQIEHLTKAKQILEDISGEEVISFRAPALRVNSFTPMALKESGFRFDSSIAPQRMDMFMSLGSKNKLQWLRAPRTCYETAIDNLARRGNSGIMEVPVSSFVAPYIGTFMRISPAMNAIIRYLLYWETKESLKVINFLIHPNEIIDEEDLHLKTEKRVKGFIYSLLSDTLRHRLKLNNLGSLCAPLYEEEIKFWSSKNYEFIPIKQSI